MRLKTVDGSEVTVLIDIPEKPVGPLVPVLIPPVFGRPKEDMGALAEALIGNGCFLVFRPALLNTGDEAPGSHEYITMSSDEIVYWGKFLRTGEFRALIDAIRPGVDIANKAACVAASVGATMAFEAQSREPVFDAMALFSFVPDYIDMACRKIGRDYYDMVSLVWRYRFKGFPEMACLLSAVADQIARQTENGENARRYRLLATRLSSTEKASRSDFALSLEGIPFNGLAGLSKSLIGIWGCQYDLERNIAKAEYINIPLTFVIGDQDSYFCSEKMDEFLVAARRNGGVRRAIRLEGCDHQLRPFTAFERGAKEGISWLMRDLGVGGEYKPFSLAHIGMRRFYEIRGLALRHAKSMGFPPEFAQKVLLGKEDLGRMLRELFARPNEVAELAQLLERSKSERGGCSTILDDLEPGRLARIFSTAFEPGHYAPVAEGLGMVAGDAAILFSKAFAQQIAVRHFGGIVGALARKPETLLCLVQKFDSDVMEILGQRHALEAAQRAYQMVPAYRDFAGKNGVHSQPSTFEGFPVACKSDYIQKYPLESRCIGGTMPANGAIEESSGSSGVPTDWVRCQEEDDHLIGAGLIFYHYLFGAPDPKRPMVILSGFNQGAWASSSRTTVLGRYAAVVKDVGTDWEKILESMERLGIGPHYIIAGYPPFLRELVRIGGQRPGFAWSRYKVDLLHGGEGYSRGWRDYVQEHLGHDSRIVSGYGASDLEIGMACETPLSVTLRNQLEESKELREYFLETTRLPVFLGQYNPIQNFLEERHHLDGRRSVVATISNLAACQPRIRYDIGDEGRVLPYQKVREFIAERALDIDLSNSLPFPFLAIFGRLDGTISVDGGNIYPSQVEHALLGHARIGPLMRSFQMSRVEESDGSVRFRVDIEAFEDTGSGNSSIEEMAGNALTEHLCGVNADYRESLLHNPGLRPIVRVLPRGSLGVGKTIKNRYIA